MDSDIQDITVDCMVTGAEPPVSDCLAHSIEMPAWLSYHKLLLHLSPSLSTLYQEADHIEGFLPLLVVRLLLLLGSRKLQSKTLSKVSSIAWCNHLLVLVEDCILKLLFSTFI